MNRSIAVLLSVCLVAGSVGAYPLDLSEQTGIHRLQAYYLAREILLERGTLPSGALWTSDQVKLRLTNQKTLTIPPADPEASARLKELAGADAAAYGIAVIDLSDPNRPVYAALNDGRAQLPASVGKIVLFLAFFQALADVYPNDVAARQRVLKDTIITADDWIIKDNHDVPIWKPGDPSVKHRPIQLGEQANLYTFLDWTASASSNAAAATVQKNLILLKHFGAEYPVSNAKADAFLADTPKSKLSSIFINAMEEPLKRNGLSPGHLKKTSFFTKTGKSRVSGSGSTSTPRELAKFAFFMEQGKLVDEWSSLEIKRLLYLTDSRFRFSAEPTLGNSAVYFKSGSWYGCKEEAGFSCGKFMGNKMNYMNSLAIVETENANQSLHYIVVILSNVLRKNSSDVHQEMGRGIHQLIQAGHGARAPVATEGN